MMRHLPHSWVLALAIGFAPALLADPPSGKAPPEADLTAKDRAHWAFQKPKRHPAPQVRDAAWVRNPIDAFILARLEKAELQPAATADRATLLRRVTFDLTGLPPTPAELDAFLTDARPDAYARVVERLLASPQYGERWAQHWLDVVRYAESNGYEVDGERPHAWRYRDYVIQAFSEDKPYDRFLTEQLAGDELARDKDPRANAELLIAVGFHRCGPIHMVSGNIDPAIARQEVLTEMTMGVGSAFLGLTVGCARCHDHKFDPVSIGDYYKLEAFFANAQLKDVEISTAEERASYDQRLKELNAKLAPIKKQIAELDGPYKARLREAKKSQLEAKYTDALAVEAAKRSPEQKTLAAQAEILLKVSWDELLDALTPEERLKRSGWRAELHALEAQMPRPPAKAWTITADAKTPLTYILKRGDVKRKTIAVQPAFPRVLEAKPDADKPDAPEQERLSRLALARWLTQPDHPLTARVLVNRLWQHHFGRGIVATPNDFGLRGEAPTHPELLDWLATEFVASGWSIKAMHRLMVLSNTYQMAGQGRDPQAAKIDPDNRLLSRMNRRRLDGEALRDSLLATAGTLHRAGGGPMIRVPLEPEVYDLIFTEGEPDGLWHVTPDARQHGRRSIYLFAKRNVRLPLFEAFDRPDALTSCPVRSVSTFAPQALILMNGPLAQAQSKAFASRLLRECGTKHDQLLERAYRLALARPPRTAEIQLGREFLAEQSDLLRDRLRARLPVGVPPDLPADVDPALAAALADFCLALFNSNEFMYVK